MMCDTSPTNLLILLPHLPASRAWQVKASLRKLVKDVQDVEEKKKHHLETSGVMSRAVASAFEKAAQVHKRPRGLRSSSADFTSCLSWCLDASSPNARPLLRLTSLFASAPARASAGDGTAVGSRGPALPDATSRLLCHCRRRPLCPRGAAGERAAPAQREGRRYRSRLGLQF